MGEPQKDEAGGIPGWVGPILGPVIAVALYFRVVRKSGDEVDVGILATMAVLGLVAGGLMWLIDVRRRRKQR